MQDAPLLLIGSGGGIGLGMAERLLAQGRSLLLTYRREDEAVLRLAQRAPEQVLGIFELDLAEPQALEALFAGIGREHACLSAVINTIGPFSQTPLAALTPAEFARLVNDNLVQAFTCAAFARPFLLAQGSGQLVYFTFAGVEKNQAYTDIAAYAAAKSGLLSLIRSLAKQWLPDGITVNAIAPGIATHAEKSQHAILTKTPGAQAVTHDELFAALSLLLSPEGAAITGQNLTVARGFGL